MNSEDKKSFSEKKKTDSEKILTESNSIKSFLRFDSAVQVKRMRKTRHNKQTTVLVTVALSDKQTVSKHGKRFYLKPFAYRRKNKYTSDEYSRDCGNTALHIHRTDGVSL